MIPPMMHDLIHCSSLTLQVEQDCREWREMNVEDCFLPPHDPCPLLLYRN